MKAIAIITAISALLAATPTESVTLKHWYLPKTGTGCGIGLFAQTDEGKAHGLYTTENYGLFFNGMQVGGWDAFTPLFELHHETIEALLSSRPGFLDEKKYVDFSDACSIRIQMDYFLPAKEVLLARFDKALKMIETGEIKEYFGPSSVWPREDFKLDNFSHRGIVIIDEMYVVNDHLTCPVKWLTKELAEEAAQTWVADIDAPMVEKAVEEVEVVSVDSMVAATKAIKKAIKSSSHILTLPSKYVKQEEAIT